MKTQLLSVAAVMCLLCVALQLSAQIESFPFDIPGADDAVAALYIENLDTGDVPVDINGDLPLIPASVTKLVTAATVLDNTPADFSYTTTVYASGVISDSILNGNIIIYSTGDPTLQSAYMPCDYSFTDSVVNAVISKGIKRICGKIKVKYDRWLEEKAPDGWLDTDLVWGYGTGYHAVNFRDNCLVLSLPDKLCVPPAPTVDINYSKCRGRLEYTRPRDSETINICGNIPKRGVREKLANPNPEASLIAEIKKKLHESDIEINDNNVKDDSLQVLILHKSPRLIEILKSMMFRSDNMFAEAMLKLSNPGKSRKDAAKSELKLWRSRGVDCDNMKIVDGSGLSRDNRLSAYFLADVLVWKGAEHTDCDYVDLFPKCGEEGTVRNLLKDTPLQGKIALKSGSMKGVRCYAGYAFGDAGNPTHVIVIMINEYNGNISRLKKEIENLLLQNIH